MGYVGPVLGRHLRRVFPDARLIGFDTGYFALCTTGARVWPERAYDVQIYGDVRDIDASLLEGVDAVVAARRRSPTIRWARASRRATDAINRGAAVRLAELAAAAGVRHFVFASSLQRLWLRAGRRAQGERSAQPADRLCALEDRHRARACRDGPEGHDDDLSALRHRLRHVGPPAARSRAQRFRRQRGRGAQHHGAVGRLAVAAADRRFATWRAPSTGR